MEKMEKEIPVFSAAKARQSTTSGTLPYPYFWLPRPISEIQVPDVAVGNSVQAHAR